MKMPWVLVKRKDWDHKCTENHVLREALRDANVEVRKHRIVLAGLSQGQEDITAPVEKALSTKGAVKC